MEFDRQSQSPKNGNGTHRARRLSGARRAQGTGTDLPVGRASSSPSTFDGFIASANATMAVPMAGRLR